MALPIITIVVRSEFYAFTLASTPVLAYLVTDLLGAVVPNDLVLIHNTPQGEAICLYRGETIITNGVPRKIVYVDSEQTALATIHESNGQQVLVQILILSNMPPPSAAKALIKKNKMKSKQVQQELYYYSFETNITPIDTEIILTRTTTPENPIPPPRVNRGLLKGYSNLYYQSFVALNVYQTIKTQAQCDTNITIGQAAKCDRLLASYT